MSSCRGASLRLRPWPSWKGPRPRKGQRARSRALLLSTFRFLLIVRSIEVQLLTQKQAISAFIRMGCADEQPLGSPESVEGVCSVNINDWLSLSSADFAA